MSQHTGHCHAFKIFNHFINKYLMSRRAHIWSNYFISPSYRRLETRLETPAFLHHTGSWPKTMTSQGLQSSVV